MERVIIVDDELPFLSYMEKLLQKFPAVQVVGKFQNGLHALHFLEKTPNVTLAFIDIQMPIMGGLELAKWINENKPTIKVILISAYQEFHYAQEAIRANVYHYLCKPFRMNELDSLFENLAQLRLQEQRHNLYVRDLVYEKQIIDLYHHINSGESGYFYSVWIFLFQTPTPGQIPRNMLITALGNILRYCAHDTRALVTTNGDVYHAVLMAETADDLPKASDFEQKARSLLGFAVNVIALPNDSVHQLGSVAFENISKATVIIIEQAKAYIRMNISTELSRDAVAKAVYMSPSHFSRIFKKEMGKSFQEYVKKARLERVIELLGQGYKISDASVAAGFTNQNYFNEVFRKEFGCSPSEYKKLTRHMGQAYEKD